MVNINFIPDDYIKVRESCRTNILYLVLFLITMAALGGVFCVIKVRQRSIDAQSVIVNEELTRAQETINQLEQIQAKRRIMMKSALTTMELIEPVQRSVLLAALTNSLPGGTSLTKIKLAEKEYTKAVRKVYSSRYAAAKERPGRASEPKEAAGKLLRTDIEIEGIAPSDIQVAEYIASLSELVLLDDVGLVLSREHDIDGEVFRQFKLSARLNKNVELSREAVAAIKAGRLKML